MDTPPGNVLERERGCFRPEADRVSFSPPTNFDENGEIAVAGAKFVRHEAHILDDANNPR